jgi:hypothetical protein
MRKKNCSVNFSPEQLDRIDEIAKERGQSRSEVIGELLDLALGFDLEAVRGFEQGLAHMRLPGAIIMQNLSAYAIALAFAQNATFGKSEVYRKAFQFDDEGRLLVGSDLLDKLLREFKEIGEQLNQALKPTEKKGKRKDVWISKEQAELLMTGM